jgi:hypothetical protein
MEKNNRLNAVKVKIDPKQNSIFYFFVFDDFAINKNIQLLPEKHFC